MLNSFIVVASSIVVSVNLTPLLAVGADSKQTGSDIRVTARTQAEPYIDWLPEESETLTVLHSPYRIPVEYPTHNVRSFSVRMNENMMGVVFAGPLRQLLAGKTVTMSIEAACRFRVPQVDPPITPLIYDGCCIFVFDRESRLNDSRILDSLEESGVRRGRPRRARRHTIENQTVLEYLPKNAEQFPRGFSYWVSLPSPGVLIIATENTFISTVLKRINNPEKLAFPDRLEEWGHIGADARKWGIRHFGASIGETDVSDPRRPWGNDPEAHATGIALQINTHAQRAHIAVLGCDELMIRRLSFGIRNAVHQDALSEVMPNGLLRIDIDWSAEPPDQMKRVEGRLSGWLQNILGYAVVI
jgi:hypothetical protein